MTTNLVTTHMTTNLVTVHMTTNLAIGPMTTKDKRSLHLQSGRGEENDKNVREENAVDSPREITTVITEERDDHRFPPLDLTLP